MATSTLALVGIRSGADSLVNYVLRAGVDSSNSTLQYVGNNTDDSLSEPRLIDIKLALKPIGNAGNNRVNISFKQVKLEDDGTPSILSGTTAIALPQSNKFSTEDVASLLAQMAHYIAGIAKSAVSGKTDTSGYPASWAKAIVP